MRTYGRNERIVKMIAAAAALALFAAVFAGCAKKAPDTETVTPEPEYGFAVAMARTTSTAETGTGTRLTALAEGESFKVSMTAEISGRDMHITRTFSDEDGDHSICEVIIKDGKMYVAADAFNDILRRLYGAVYGEEAAEMFPTRFITTDIDPEEYVGSIDPEALEEKLGELDDALIEAGIMTGGEDGFSLRGSAADMERIIKETFENSDYEEKLEETLEMLKSEGWSASAGNITFSLELEDFDGRISAPKAEDTRELPVSSWLGGLKNFLTGGEE